MSDLADHNRRLLLTAVTGMVLPSAAGTTADGATIIAGGTDPSVITTKQQHTLSVRDFGAVGDGKTQDGPAFNAMVRALPLGGPVDVPAGIYLVGGQVFGPARGNRHAYDHAIIGDEEIVAQPKFSGLISRWALTRFDRRAAGIFHPAGDVGRATTTVEVLAYTTYLVTIGVSTDLAGGVAFTLAGEPVFTERDYSFLPAGAASYRFALFTYAVNGQVELGVVTDPDWSGTIESLSVKRVVRETPYDFFSLAADRKDFANVLGIKFGRFLSGNIAIGDRLAGSLFSEKAAWNIAIGPRSLSTTTDGFENTALGAFALEYNQVDRNTAGGYSSFRYNTTGIQNTGWGYKTFGRNSTGSNNTGVGFWASMYNKMGGNNSSFGALAGYYNCNGSYNAAFGSQAGLQNDGGRGNTYIGALAGPYTTGAKTFSYDYSTCVGAESKGYGNNTTAIGYQARCGADPYEGGVPITTAAMAVGQNAVALSNNSLAAGCSASATQRGSTAIGDHAAARGVTSTAIGNQAEANGQSISIGYEAGKNLSADSAISIGNGANSFDKKTNLHNVIAIGDNARNTRNNQIILGNENSRTVDVGFASLKFNADIRHMANIKTIASAKSLKFISNLKPSTWNWNIDSDKAEQEISYGIVAQDVIRAMNESGLDYAGIIDRHDPNNLKLDILSVIGILCSAVQALSAKVELLENKK